MSQAATSTDAAAAKRHPNDRNIAAAAENGATTQTQFISFDIGHREFDIVSVEAAQNQKVPRTALGEQIEFLSGLATHNGVMMH
jgi:hypothetical protein